MRKMSWTNSMEVEKAKRFSSYLKMYSHLLRLRGLLSFPEFKESISDEEKADVKKLEEKFTELIKLVNEIGGITQPCNAAPTHKGRVVDDAV